MRKPNNTTKQYAYISILSALMLGACASTSDLPTPAHSPIGHGNNNQSNSNQKPQGETPTSNNNGSVIDSRPLDSNPIITPEKQEPITPIQPPPAAPSTTSTIGLSRGSFMVLPNWEATDYTAARSAFIRSCSVIMKRNGDNDLSVNATYAGKVSQWKSACDAAKNYSLDSKSFWETYFTPWRISTKSGERGKLTSYFEPVMRASLTKTATYNEPLYGKPSDLVNINLADFDPALAGKKIVGRIVGNDLVPYRTRAQITPSNAPVLAWAKTGEALSLQIQGSGRLLLNDGRQMRAAFAATNGRPFGSVARELIRRGELPQNQASADNITNWFANAPENKSRDVLNANQRTTFFALQEINNPTEGPKGSMGVPLVAGGSLAIDPSIHAYGVPFFIFANSPLLSNSSHSSMTRLVIAQDTGGAIKGPMRGDLFYGTGDEAGLAAGRINHGSDWWILLPNGINPPPKVMASKH